MTGTFFSHLLSNLEKQRSEGELTISSHVKSLLSLAHNNIDSIDYKYFYAYYSVMYEADRYTYIQRAIDFALTDEFKNDSKILTPELLVKKYGTHVLSEYITGKKFEVLYKGKLEEDRPDIVETEKGERTIKEGLFRRLDEFFKGTELIGYNSNQKDYYKVTDEEMIFNVMGGGTKYQGLISITNYNPDSVFVDAYSKFDNEKKYQLMSVYDTGIEPLYKLINDSIKQEEVKAYIEKYLSE